MSRGFSILTRKAIRSLPAGKSLTEHGVTFTRNSCGDGVFSVNIMVDRRRIHRVIGRESEGVTRQQAEDFIASARTDARRGRLDLPEGRKTPLGFREAANSYIARLQAEDGRNIKAKRRQLDQHLIPFFGDRPLFQLTSFEIERYKRSRLVMNPSRATINRELAVVSHLLNKALEWGWIKALPGKIRRYKEDTGRIVYLTQAQCSALEMAAAQDQNSNVHCFVRIALRTGMRHQEMLSIRCENIDIHRRTIWIPKAKAGAREQPITPDLANYLQDRLEMLPKGTPWLFPSPGSRTGHVHTIRKAFRRAAGRASLDPDQITPHTLRHTVVTHLVQAGVDLPTVQRISGHKTLTMMVARYAHQNGTHVAIAMNKLQDRLTLGNDNDLAVAGPAGLNKSAIQKRHA